MNYSFFFQMLYCNEKKFFCRFWKRHKYSIKFFRRREILCIYIIQMNLRIFHTVLYSILMSNRILLYSYNQRSFAILCKASLIVGVEKNPIAHQYAVQNCMKYPQIHLYNIDAKDFSSSEKFDRILMPLPKSAAEEIEKKPLDLIRTKVLSFKVLSVVKCGQYAPKKFRVCVDFTLE